MIAGVPNPGGVPSYKKENQKPENTLRQKVRSKILHRRSVLGSGKTVGSIWSIPKRASCITIFIRFTKTKLLYSNWFLQTSISRIVINFYNIIRK